MAGQSRDNENNIKTERSKKRFRPIFIILSVLAFCLFIWKYFSYELAYKKLVAIETARAIPETENAERIYNKLLGYGVSPFEYDFQSKDVEDATLSKPWSGKDYPELAKWYEQKRDILNDLLQVSQIEQCRFPITSFTKGSDLRERRMKAMRTWTFYLVRAANKDIAEGRIEQALEKCFCLIRMGRHNRQQPLALDFSIGITIESMALKRMRTCILESDVTDENLRDIETAISQPNSEWSQDLDNMLAVEKIYVKMLPQIPSKPGWRYKLKAWWEKKRNQKAKINRVKEIYTRLLTDRRGNQILIGLRRFRNENSRWPESLDVILPFIDKNIFIDPQNNSPFVYNLSDDSFILYGKGLNKTDENGIDKNGADDRAIWPLQISQNGKENAAMEQSVPERKEIE